MEAAAITCWAHPQSMDAMYKMSSEFAAKYDKGNKCHLPTPAMEPSVFASILSIVLDNVGTSVSHIYEQPTIHANKFLHLGDDNEWVQK
jgi:hypothetical protein